VATLAGDAHLRPIRGVCRAVDVREENWSSGPEPGPPHLLLIESSGLMGGDGPNDQKVERALELVDWSESHDVPTAFWETSISPRIKTPLPLMHRIRHLFVADPQAARLLTDQLDGRVPIVLPFAAQVIPDKSPAFDARRHDVTFAILGGRIDTFGAQMRRQLEAILDVASDYGLVILQRQRDIDADAIPGRFSRFVMPVRSAGHAVERFRDSRVVIGIDPSNYGELMVPQIALDALAAGSAVVVPEFRALKRMVRYSVVIAKKREEAEAAMERLLGDDSEWSEASAQGRKAILHAHTYAHRLATVASAVGFRLVPNGTTRSAVTGS
jgi:hypothetical protein